MAVSTGEWEWMGRLFRPAFDGMAGRPSEPSFVLPSSVGRVPYYYLLSSALVPVCGQLQIQLSHYPLGRRRVAVAVGVWRTFAT